MAGFDNDLLHCIQVINTGGTILYPTDTVWGVGCDALNETAIEKVYELKCRPGQKSMIMLLADAKDIAKHALINNKMLEKIEQFDTPTTVVLKAQKSLPANLVNADGTIAIRIPKDAFCKKLIQMTGKPIISTSANISGQPTAAIFGQINQAILNGVDYVVKYRQEETQPAAPSRIVTFNEDGTFDHIR